MSVLTFTLVILRRFLANFFFGDDSDPDVVLISVGLCGDNLGPRCSTSALASVMASHGAAWPVYPTTGSILELSSERLNSTSLSSQALFQPLPDVNVGPEIQLPLSSLGRIFDQSSARVSVFVSVVSVPLSGRWRRSASGGHWLCGCSIPPLIQHQHLLPGRRR